LAYTYDARVASRKRRRLHAATRSNGGGGNVARVSTLGNGKAPPTRGNGGGDGGIDLL